MSLENMQKIGSSTHRTVMIVADRLADCVRKIGAFAILVEPGAARRRTGSTNSVSPGAGSDLYVGGFGATAVACARHVVLSCRASRARLARARPIPRVSLRVAARPVRPLGTSGG